LGRTELPISCFSLGTMRCLESPEVYYRTVVAALERGVNHLETAPSYGPSEEYLGQALGRGLARADLYITSKLLPTIENVEQELQAILDRLRTSYLDCIAIHGINRPEHLTEAIERLVPALQQAQARGLVRHIGFSTHGDLDLVTRAIKTGLFSFVNLHYYYFSQRLAPAIELAQAQDMGVFIISPGDKGGQLFRPSAKLLELCQPYSPLALTYRWLLQDQRVTTLSVGAARPEELMEPLAIEAGPLDEQEAATLARLTQYLQDALGADLCGQCQACLPCPEDIAIPEILRLRNLAVAYDMTSYGQYRYRMLENAGHWFPGQRGNRCTDCGDCLPRCPQALNIPQLLGDTHDRLHTGEGRRLWDN
jgi:uncharacterized protein